VLIATSSTSVVTCTVSAVAVAGASVAVGAPAAGVAATAAGGAAPGTACGMRLARSLPAAVAPCVPVGLVAGVLVAATSGGGP
jgi:hypothetical protein